MNQNNPPPANQPRPRRPARWLPWTIAATVAVIAISVLAATCSIKLTAGTYDQAKLARDHVDRHRQSIAADIIWSLPHFHLDPQFGQTAVAALGPALNVDCPSEPVARYPNIIRCTLQATIQVPDPITISAHADIHFPDSRPAIRDIVVDRERSYLRGIPFTTSAVLPAS